MKQIIDTDGNPLKTNNEQKYKNNKYFYPLPAQIIDGMERALLEFGVDEVNHKKEKRDKRAISDVQEPVKGESKTDKKEEKKVEKKVIRGFRDHFDSSPIIAS